MSRSRENTILTIVSTCSQRHGAAAGESLGSEVIAGHLLGERGPEVSVDHIDLQLDPSISDLLTRISEEKPDILGISVKIGALDQLDEIMRYIRDDQMVVLGGVVATFAGKNILERYPRAIIVIGEGELAADHLVDVAKGDKDLSQVPGIMYLDQGQIVVTRRIRPDLSKRHLPARITTQRVIHELNGLVWSEAARGCDGRCTFCSVRELHDCGFDGSVSVDSIIEDMKILQQMGVEVVSFTDDDFCGDPARAVEIARRIRAEVPGIKYTISTRADHFWAEKLPKHLEGQKTLEQYNIELLEMAQELARSGLVRVFIGLESGSPSQLRRYGKRISVQGNYRAIEILRQLGIDVVAGYIPIDQMMTIQELKENLDFLRATGMYLKVSNPLSVLRVQAGSPYLRMLAHNGLLGEQTDDLVFYEASFLNPDVEQISVLAGQWVNDLYSLVFGLKNEAARVVNGSGGDAAAVLAQQFIFQLRELEMQFLEALVEESMKSFGPSNLQPIVDQFKLRRKQIVERVKQAAEDGRLNSDNRRLMAAVDSIIR